MYLHIARRRETEKKNEFPSSAKKKGGKERENVQVLLARAKGAGLR